MRTRLIAILAVVAALAVACGDADQAAAPDPAPPITQPEPTQPAPDPTPTTQPPVPTTSAPVPTTQPPVPTTQPPVPTTSAPVPTTQAPPPGLPGEPWEHGPERGAQLGVVAVAHDDVLNVRRGPGVDHEVVTRLEPLATGVVATGSARRLDSGAIWVEVAAGGATGWANQAFLSRQAHTVDSTAAVVDLLGERPTAASLAELGRIVADAVTFGDNSATIVLVKAPQGEHDIGEVVYDVVGFGDDSVSGARLHVFGRPSDDRQSFSLHSVEETPFCFRGVTPEGLCA